MNPINLSSPGVPFLPTSSPIVVSASRRVLIAVVIMTLVAFGAILKYFFSNQVLEIKAHVTRKSLELGTYFNQRLNAISARLPNAPITQNLSTSAQPSIPHLPETSSSSAPALSPENEAALAELEALVLDLGEAPLPPPDAAPIYYDEEEQEKLRRPFYKAIMKRDVPDDFRGEWDARYEIDDLTVAMHMRNIKRRADRKNSPFDFYEAMFGALMAFKESTWWVTDQYPHQWDLMKTCLQSLTIEERKRVEELKKIAEKNLVPSPSSLNQKNVGAAIPAGSPPPPPVGGPPPPPPPPPAPLLPSSSFSSPSVPSGNRLATIQGVVLKKTPVAEKPKDSSITSMFEEAILSRRTSIGDSDEEVEDTAWD